MPGRAFPEEAVQGPPNTHPGLRLCLRWVPTWPRQGQWALGGRGFTVQPASLCVQVETDEALRGLNTGVIHGSGVGAAEGQEAGE